MKTQLSIKSILILAILSLLECEVIFAQNVAIGETIFQANPSSLLELKSSERGFLITRLTTTERDAIQNPAEALMIFNTTTKCLEIYINGWQQLWCENESFECGVETVSDIEGNIYNTVLIGDQCWLKKNLFTKTYPNGNPIIKGDYIHGSSNWGSDKAWYSCPPNTSNNGENCVVSKELGLLYQWSAAMNGALACNGLDSTFPQCSIHVQGICPDGWHIPSHYEIVKLERYICYANGGGGDCLTQFMFDESTTGNKGFNGEGSSLAANALGGVQNWNNGGLRQHANFQSSGFNAVPSGYRNSFSGDYFNRGNNTYIWTTTQKASNTAWHRHIRYEYSNISRIYGLKSHGHSVRCLKDY